MLQSVPFKIAGIFFYIHLFKIRPVEKPFHGSKIILALLKNASERIICRNLNQRCKYKDPSSGNVYIIAQT